MKYRKNFYQIKSNQEIFKKIQAEIESIGYYQLPFQETEKIKQYANKIRQKNIVVIGMGGSSLGAKAIHNFLNSSRSFNKNLIFIDTVDPLKINFCLNRIELLDSHFIAISKSGNTIETISILKYIDSLISINTLNCTTITEKNSKLNLFADQNNIESFFLDPNVGGRFSVFSEVGLLPLAMVGVDIDELLNGCKRVYKSFFSKEEYFENIINKARFLVENKSRFNINVVFSYSSILEGFNNWYIQLWAESLGKLNINKTRQALTPIGLIGPGDQHSFLQLIIDGVRDKTLTFIKVDDLKDKSSIPKNNSEKFDLLPWKTAEGLSFNNLLNKQADATIQSVINQNDIPCDVITISTVDEYNIAKLMFSYQLLTSCIGAFLQINTYNQPGVEDGKINLEKTLRDL